MASFFSLLFVNFSIKINLNGGIFGAWIRSLFQCQTCLLKSLVRVRIGRSKWFFHPHSEPEQRRQVPALSTQCRHPCARWWYALPPSLRALSPELEFNVLVGRREPSTPPYTYHHMHRVLNPLTYSCHALLHLTHVTETCKLLFTVLL